MAKPPAPKDSDVKLVRALADVLEEAGLTEIEYATDAVSVRVSKAATVTHSPQVTPQAAPQAASQAIAAAPEVDEIGAHPGAIKSPMVGTVYLSPEPGASPFINEGDTVREGQTLLIIEAMKVMNPITATKAGVVKKIIISDGLPVEYDQPLLIIE